MKSWYFTLEKTVIILNYLEKNEIRINNQVLTI